MINSIWVDDVTRATCEMPQCIDNLTIVMIQMAATTVCVVLTGDLCDIIHFANVLLLVYNVDFNIVELKFGDDR